MTDSDLTGFGNTQASAFQAAWVIPVNVQPGSNTTIEATWAESVSGLIISPTGSNINLTNYV